MYIRRAVLSVYFPFVPRMACDGVTFTFIFQLVKYAVDSACYGEASENLFGDLIRSFVLVCRYNFVNTYFSCRDIRENFR